MKKKNFDTNLYIAVQNKNTYKFEGKSLKDFYPFEKVNFKLICIRIVYVVHYKWISDIAHIICG